MAQFTSLPPQLESTSVVLPGVELPLLYASSTQVNVAIPLERSGEYVAAVGGAARERGFGAGLAGGVLRASNHGSAGGYECAGGGGRLSGDVHAWVGRGTVSPTLAIEDGTPSAPLSYEVGPVSVTIGGVPATVLFAGLTPGYVGRYQVKVTMPSGVTPGSQVPVTVSVAGKSAAENITIAVH